MLYQVPSKVFYSLSFSPLLRNTDRLIFKGFFGTSVRGMELASATTTQTPLRASWLEKVFFVPNCAEALFQPCALFRYMYCAIRRKNSGFVTKTNNHGS